MGDSREAEILEEVERLARERFGSTAPISPETRLVEDLGLDSLKALEMMVEIENQFKVRIDEDSELEIATVDDLVKTIRRSLEAEGGRG